jgi:DNA-binding NtrC family response regulator
MGMKVLIVNDEVLIAEQMKRHFEHFDVEPFVAKNYKDALKIAEKEQPEMAVVDQTLWGEEGGMELAFKIRRRVGLRIFIVLMSAYSVDQIREGYPKRAWSKLYTTINLFEAPYQVGMMQLMIDEWIKAAKKYFKRT